ncbi:MULTISPECIES: hypothetical protein [Rhizobium]|uniref:Uncharacterized protein n=1 Tax=Rhizobium paranaense TaxID=1650438 RepID=A0A7W9CZQ2_9HYPH|nr:MULTISPECIES: hypothetical protein [Rhizobium]MBB5572225.1 hypothetical protein [Rhizobium paranaense]PST63302.1 hypothetical protein C9E91_07885 [Rhizobium sp. SEMIA4064]
MSASETHSFQYFMPELHLKTVLQISLMGLLLFLLVVPNTDAAFKLLLILLLLPVSFYVVVALRTITSQSNSAIVTIGPEGILDSRFGLGFIPWSAIEHIDVDALKFEPNSPNAEILRFISRGTLRLLAMSGLYGKLTIPSDLSLSKYRDRRNIKFWLRSGVHLEQTTPAARLRIKDNKDGTQRVYIAMANLSVSRKELLDLMLAFHKQYASAAPATPVT